MSSSVSSVLVPFKFLLIMFQLILIIMIIITKVPLPSCSLPPDLLLGLIHSCGTRLRLVLLLSRL